MQSQCHAKFFFSAKNPFTGGSYISIQKFSFRSQGYPMLGADEEPAPQFAFQILHTAGYRRLTGKQYVCGFGKIAVLSDVIEYFIIVKTSRHGNTPLVICKIDIIYISYYYFSIWYKHSIIRQEQNRK